MSDKKKKLSAEEARMAKALAAKDAINDPQVESTDTEATNMEAAVAAGGLGKVNMGNFGPDRAQSSDSALGWHVLDLEQLPSKAKFYPKGTVIKIRSAKAAEIRHFSTMDENNYIDMEDKLNSIVESTALETNKRYLGSIQEVLAEGINTKNNKQLMGRTRTNRLTFFPADNQDGSSHKEGDVIKVLIQEIRPFSLSGIPLN